MIALLMTTLTKSIADLLTACQKTDVDNHTVNIRVTYDLHISLLAVTGFLYWIYYFKSVVTQVSRDAE